MSALLKNLLFALGLVLIVWLGYTVFFKDDTEDLTVTNTALSSDAARDAQDFLVLINQLKEINFESSLFSDPAFQSLKNYQKEIVGEPVGRVNPFEPVR